VHIAEQALSCDEMLSIRDRLRIQLVFSGGAAEGGEIPMGELGQAMDGWERLLQISIGASETAELKVVPRDSMFRVQCIPTSIGPGSVIVEVVLWFANAAAQGIIGNAAHDAVRRRLKRGLQIGRDFVNTLLAAKRENDDKDAAIARLEAVASTSGLRIPQDRDESEHLLDAVDAALVAATIPLESAAGQVALRVPGEPLSITIDSNGRHLIKMPFAEPMPVAGEVIDRAPVKFIRINKKTATGLLRFVRPNHPAQVASQQYFRCVDRAIRRPGNVYTGAFHKDVVLDVAIQLRAYDAHRKGHYWLVLGPAEPNPNGDDLFAGNSQASARPSVRDEARATAEKQRASNTKHKSRKR
jgi:hypothetical protein